MPRFRPRRRWLLAAAPILFPFLALEASAESALILAMPEVFGSVPAATYDEDGRRLGDARLAVERIDDGAVRLLSESGIEGGARTLATAELAPAGDGLRLQLQESRSFDPTGAPLGVLRIDHRNAVATCTPPDGSPADRLELPRGDRVANVPFNLLFLPLVRGEQKEIEWDFVLCNGGARTMTFEAHVASREPDPDGPGDRVEIRYGPRLGRMVSLIAAHVLPKLAFWFDSKSRDPWLAHRLPLYAKGPEVMVIRDGISTLDIVNGR